MSQGSPLLLGADGPSRCGDCVGVRYSTMAGVIASGSRAAAASVLSQCRSRVHRAPVALRSSPSGRPVTRPQLKQQRSSLLALHRQTPLRACRARQVQVSRFAGPCSHVSVPHLNCMVPDIKQP